MIIGIGTDIVNIERIERLSNKYGDDFLHKNYHPREVEIYAELPESARVSFLAKRFAAKEAFAKALRTGIGDGIRFCDIATLNHENGAPYIYLSPERFPQLASYNIDVSLSDDYPFAVAFTIISE